MSITYSSVTPHQRFTQIPITLRDPLSKAHLQNAVTLIPCGHSLSFDIAQKFFGDTGIQLVPRGNLTLSITRPGVCPECFEHLFSYVSNHALRQIEQSLRTIKDLFDMHITHKAVILAPCGHSIKESTAQRLYGSPYQMLLNGHGNCPTCFLYVITYVPDCTLRKLEKLRMHALNKMNTHKRSNAYKHSLPRSILTTILPKLPFPGIGAHLECFSPWSALDCDPQTSIKRAMTFYSHAHVSFLTKAVVYGDCNGKVSVALTCRESQVETFHRYLCHLGVLKASDCFKGTFCAHRSAELNWAHDFLIKHHTFSNQRDLTLLERLLHDKRWFHLETKDMLCVQWY